MRMYPYHGTMEMTWQEASTGRLNKTDTIWSQALTNLKATAQSMGLVKEATGSHLVHRNWRSAITLVVPQIVDYQGG